MRVKRVLLKIVLTKRFFIGLPFAVAVLLLGTVFQTWTHGHFHPEFLFGLWTGVVLGYVIAMVNQAILESLQSALDVIEEEEKVRE